jgi:hypothetical protein
MAEKKSPPKNQVIRDFSIAGSTFINGGTALMKRLRARQRLELVREPTNRYHANAVMVCWGNRQIGYLPAGLADEIAPMLDAGVKVIAQKAPVALESVCQLAWIKQPAPPAAPEPPADLTSAQTPTRAVDMPEEQPPQKEEPNDESDPLTDPGAQ